MIPTSLNRNEVRSYSVLMVGVGACLCAVAFFFSRTAFFAGLLQGLGMWLALWLGAIGLLILFQLTGGRWGVALHSYLKDIARTFPVTWILFLPVALGLSQLYSWVPHDGAVMHGVVEAKRAYLNTGAFYLRALFYLVLWTALAFRFTHTKPIGKGTAGISLLLFVLSSSFAAFDWFMSLEPEWFSSLYGALFLVSCLITILAVGTLRLFFSAPESSPDVFHDLGKLLLMAVMLWGYLNFSQFLIIWNANIPEEMTWYHHRGHGIWYAVGLGLVLFHFFVPFFLLLSRQLKRQGRSVALIAAFLLFMRMVDWTWWVQPAFEMKWIASLSAALGGTLLTMGLGAIAIIRATPFTVPQDRPYKRGERR